jgi:hypothetical protein
MKILKIFSVVAVFVQLALSGNAFAQAEIGTFEPFSTQSAFIRVQEGTYVAVENWPNSTATKIELEVEQVGTNYDISLHNTSRLSSPDYAIWGVRAVNGGSPRFTVGDLFGTDSVSQPVRISPGSKIIVLISRQEDSVRIDATIQDGSSSINISKSVNTKSAPAESRFVVFGMSGNIRVQYGTLKVK